MPATLAYWKIRGLAQPARLMLNYAGIEFIEKFYEYGGNAELNWPLNKAKNSMGLDFPNLPYFIEGDLKVTQSNAVYRHIARKCNLYGSSEKDMALVDMLADQIMDVRNSFVQLAYNPQFKSLLPAYKKELQTKLELFEKFLGQKQWLIGDQLTFADFHLYEMLDQHLILVPDSLDGLPSLLAYHHRFQEIPAIKKYMQSENFMKRPINNTFAALNN